VTRVARPPADPPPFDAELADLPPDLRWREWAMRVEAVLFAAAAPVPRTVLEHLVGRDCPVDVLVADIRESLRDRPYEIVAVGDGWTLRTRRAFADAIRRSRAAEAQAVTLGTEDLQILAGIALNQPVTRRALGEITGREIDRDRIARLRALALLATGPRSPEPGAPPTLVTTDAFLALFGLRSLEELRDATQAADTEEG
jgi:segregation and condensation protein B